MTRILTAEELNKLAGRRLNADERAAWREAASRRGETRSNREGPDADPTNPYAGPLSECNPNSYNPRERRRYERLKRLHDEKEAQLVDARKAEQIRLRMETDPDLDRARTHLAGVLNTFSTYLPEDLVDKGDAMNAIQSALSTGDKKCLDDYWDAAGRIADRHLASLSEELNDARKADIDSTVERNRLEMEMKKAEAASLQPPH